MKELLVEEVNKVVRFEFEGNEFLRYNLKNKKISTKTFNGSFDDFLKYQEFVKIAIEYINQYYK
jgi:hypothetical protein